jgi:predicted ATPase
MRTLQRLKISNFKSIRLQELHFHPLNIFIGGNGSGKSNLIGIFRFLKEIVNRNLAGFTKVKGGADSLLHYGRKRSPAMEVLVEFGEGRYANKFDVILVGTDEDTLFIRSETVYYQDKAKYPDKPYDMPVGSSQNESRLLDIRSQE